MKLVWIQDEVEVVVDAVRNEVILEPLEDFGVVLLSPYSSVVTAGGPYAEFRGPASIDSVKERVPSDLEQTRTRDSIWVVLPLRWVDSYNVTEHILETFEPIGNFP